MLFDVGRRERMRARRRRATTTTMEVVGRSGDEGYRKIHKRRCCFAGLGLTWSRTAEKP
jgi:hypothetical protein